MLDQWSNDSIAEGSAGVRYNECWGFSSSGVEYAVLGSTEGLHFFKITENNRFSFVDFVAGKFSHPSVTHRDFQDAYGYMYAVCDEGNSSLQIMDLQYLPDSVHVAKDTSLVTRTHNLYTDEDNGLLFLCNPTPSGQPLLIYDISQPLMPEKLAINYSILPNQVHDVYIKGEKIYMFCLFSGVHVFKLDKNTATLTKLADLEFYQDQGQCHSGWTSDDGTNLFFTDETNGTRIKSCDVSELPNISIESLFGTNYEQSTVPHNIMTRGNFAYVSYYNEGLRVYDISNPKEVTEVGYYDTYPQTSEYKLHGAWGVNTLLPSGKIIVSDRQNGLFLLDFIGDDTPFTKLSEDGVQVRHSNLNQAIYVAIDKDWQLPFDIIVTDSKGGLVYSRSSVNNSYVKINTAQWSNGAYILKVNNKEGRQTAKKIMIVQSY